MGDAQSVPVLGEAVTVVESGTKLAAAAACAVVGKTETASKLVEGAGKSVKEYTERNLIAGTINSVVQSALGKESEADRIADKTLHSFENFVDCVPVVGHAKGAVHYITGEKEHGDKCMAHATRTTAVVGAGMLTGGLGGGVVLGGVAGLGTGMIYDGKDPLKTVNKAMETGDPNKVVDVGLGFAGDFACGAVAARTTTGPAHKGNVKVVKKVGKAGKSAVKVKANTVNPGVEVVEIANGKFCLNKESNEVSSGKCDADIQDRSKSQDHSGFDDNQDCEKQDTVTEKELAQTGNKCKDDQEETSDKEYASDEEKFEKESNEKMHPTEKSCKDQKKMENMRDEEKLSKDQVHTHKATKEEVDNKNAYQEGTPNEDKNETKTEKSKGLKRDVEVNEATSNIETTHEAVEKSENEYSKYENDKGFDQNVDVDMKYGKLSETNERQSNNTGLEGDGSFTDPFAEELPGLFDEDEPGKGSTVSENPSGDEKVLVSDNNIAVGQITVIDVYFGITFLLCPNCHSGASAAIPFELATGEQVSLDSVFEYVETGCKCGWLGLPEDKC